MTISVLCVDAADTLFTERSSRASMYAAVFTELGIPVSEQVMAEGMGAEHRALCRTDLPHRRYSDAWFDLFVERLLRRSGSDLPARPVREELTRRFTDPASYRVFDEVPTALAAWRARGWRLALVSNWSDRLRELLAALDLAAPFEVLAISAEVGRHKPDPGLFHRALAALDTPPHRAAHVGNDLDLDVGCARAAGLTALWLDRTGRGEAPPGVPRVTALDQIEDHLDGA